MNQISHFNVKSLNIKEGGFKVILLLIPIIFLFFPNNNHLVDSLGYAGDVKYNVDLFAAHHLLFAWFNHLIYILVKFIFPAVDALKLMQFTNGIVALLCLLLLRKIIFKQTNDDTKATVWSVFVGCTFGVMRFAVEAETYIIPIFFSLLSSYFYLTYLKTDRTKYVFYSGLFASIACLFHQIHLFWGIGLFIGLLFSKKIKPLFIFVLSTPIVLIGYSLVLVYSKHIDFSAINLFRFLADYYYSAQADVSVGGSNVVITAVTFFRTFFQVHGLVVEVLRLQLLSYLAIPLVIGLLGISVVKLIKSLKLKPLKFRQSHFERTHFIIFILQFGFAFYSHGNSEFMVMLPFTIPIFLPLFLEFDLTALKSLSLSMLIWNAVFAILPNHFVDYQNNKALLIVINNNPGKVFILKDRNTVVNQYFYDYGVQEYWRIIDNDNKKAIRKLKKKNVIFYTDIFSKRLPYSRVQFTTDLSSSNLVFIRHITKISAAMGDFYVDEVKSLD